MELLLQLREKRPKEKRPCSPTVYRRWNCPRSSGDDWRSIAILLRINGFFDLKRHQDQAACHSVEYGGVEIVIIAFTAKE